MFAPIVIIWLIFNLSFGIYVRTLFYTQFLLANLGHRISSITITPF